MAEVLLLKYYYSSVLAFTLSVGLELENSRLAWPLGMAPSTNPSGVLFIYFKILCLWDIAWNIHIALTTLLGVLGAHKVSQTSWILMWWHITGVWAMCKKPTLEYLFVFNCKRKRKLDIQQENNSQKTPPPMP